MSDSCPVCGVGYVYGPGGKSHAGCRDIQNRRGLLDEALAWLLADPDDRDEEPLLVTRLRAEILDSGYRG